MTNHQKKKDPIEAIALATTSAWLEWRIKRSDSWINRIDKEIQNIQKKPVRFNEELLRKAKKELNALSTEQGLSDEQRKQKEETIWQTYESSKKSEKGSILSRIGISFLKLLKSFYQAERSSLQEKKIKNDLKMEISDHYDQKTQKPQRSKSKQIEQEKPSGPSRK